MGRVNQLARELLRGNLRESLYRLLESLHYYFS